MVVGVVVIGLPLYAISGQYKGLTRYAGSSVYTVWRRAMVARTAFTVVGDVQPSDATTE